MKRFSLSLSLSFSLPLFLFACKSEIQVNAWKWHRRQLQPSYKFILYVLCPQAIKIRHTTCVTHTRMIPCIYLYLFADSCARTWIVWIRGYSSMYGFSFDTLNTWHMCNVLSTRKWIYIYIYVCVCVCVCVYVYKCFYALDLFIRNTQSV